MFISGLTVVCMRVNTKMIKNKDKVPLFGLMDVNILVCGMKESNTVSGYISICKANKGRDNGEKVSVLDG